MIDLDTFIKSLKLCWIKRMKEADNNSILNRIYTYNLGSFGSYLLFDLKTYLLMRWQGFDALAVCRAHLGLPVGLLLLRYSVLFTLESLSLIYLFLYLDLYVLRDDSSIS